MSGLKVTNVRFVTSSPFRPGVSDDRCKAVLHSHTRAAALARHQRVRAKSFTSMWQLGARDFSGQH